jgi:RNA polymerase sigma-70 factor (ECF subfamily)
MCPKHTNQPADCLRTDESVQTLLDRWRAGDPAAAAAIYGRYWTRLCNLAKTRLSRQMARRVGPDDIVQSVFRSFFRRAQAGEFTVNRAESLWRLLVGITLNKVRRQSKRHHAQRRNVAAEVDVPDDRPTPEALAHEPTPDEAAALTQEVYAVLASVDGVKREMVTLCLEGNSCSEIASRLGYSRWTVRRVLDRVGEQLQRRLQPGPDD